MSSTTAPNAEFQSSGKPLAQPSYLVDPSGSPISSTNPLDVDVTVSIGPTANQRVSAQVGDLVDGAITTLGLEADTALTNAATSGTGMAFIKGFVKILADMWDSTNHWLQVKVMNANANGQATSANSAPVVPASDYIAPIKSSRTEVLGQAAANVTGTTTDLIPSQDVTGYTVAVLQLTGTWSMTLQAQQCNDNATFLQTQFLSAQTQITNASIISTTTTNGLFIIPLSGRYLRVRPSVWSSNASCVGTLELYTTPPPFALALMASSINLAPQTTGGTTTFHLVSANTTNQTNVKASTGQIYGWDITNTTAGIKYVKVHNTAGTPTAGAGVVRTIGVPASSKTSYHNTVGIPFATGIAITTVTGAADNDTTAVAASDLIIDIDYK